MSDSNARSEGQDMGRSALLPVKKVVAIEVEASGEGRRPAKAPEGSLHQGKIDADQRARRAAKALRTRSHSGEATHKPCNEYPGCNHRKHGRKP